MSDNLKEVIDRVRRDIEGVEERVVSTYRDDLVLILDAAEAGVRDGQRAMLSSTMTPGEAMLIQAARDAALEEVAEEADRTFDFSNFAASIRALKGRPS